MKVMHVLNSRIYSGAEKVVCQIINVRVSLLSQYTGLLIPLAHVKGSSGLKNTAPIDNKSFAINLSICISSFQN